jgi:hypothetical protein
MTPVQKAEKALLEAKQQETLNYRLKELKDLKKEFEGKCFGSDTFDRYSAAAYRGVVYYEKFFIEENEIYVLEHTLSLSHLDAHYKKSMKQISYSRNINQRQLTGQNDYNANYNLYSGYSQFKKKITLEKFKQLWDIAEEANLIIKNAFRGILPDLQQEWITQGDFGQESTIESCISDMGIEMIDFKQHPNVHRCIEYRTLPMFDRRRWLPKQYVKAIFEWLIKELKKDCNSQFITTRRYEALQSEIKILQDFINNLI